MNLLNKLLCVGLLAACTTDAKPPHRFSVLVIDTGIDLRDPYFKPFMCKTGHSDLTGKGLHDVHGHGTNVAGLILKDIDPKKVCIKVVKYFHNKEATAQEEIMLDNARRSGTYYQSSYSKAVSRLYELDYLMLNFSGNGMDPLGTEELAFRRALGRGAYIVVASGNESLDLNKTCTSYPACYKSLQKYENFRVVTDMGLSAANKGGPAKHNENGRGQCYKENCLNGTSQATAVHTNKLLKSLGYGYNRR